MRISDWSSDVCSSDLSALRERRDDDRGEAGVGELVGRDVDRDLQVRRPFHRFVARGAQHPFADRRNEARILGGRDEAAGGHISQLLVVPTDQSPENVQCVVGGGRVEGWGVGERSGRWWISRWSRYH